MTALDFLGNLRDPKTRWSAIRTWVFGIFVASGSISGTMAGTQGVTGVYTALTERVQFYLILSEVESLRHDVMTAPCSSNAMLLAQAAEWNRRIAHEHEANKHWYSDWASTDKWDRIKRIGIPCQK